MKTIIFWILASLLAVASTLHLSISANPSRINPIVSTDSASSTIDQWIFNALVKYDKNGNVVPDLARSYRFLSPTLLEFTLREDVLWSDGTPLRAQDVLFTYETIISPDIFTPYSSSFTHIKNVTILDELTVHVEYKYPYFKALETWMMGILPKHLLENEKNLMTSAFNQAPIGTGPYTLEGFEISKDIVLKANPRYFEGAAKIPTMIYHFLPDASTEFLMLKSHKLDMGTISPLQYERQIDDAFRSFYNVYEQISHSYVYMGMNLKDPKFADLRVREALSLGVDRQALVDFIQFGHGEVCHGPFLPGTNAYNPHVKAPQRNIEKAKALLREAGYDEHHPLTFTLTTSAGARTYIAEILQYQLQAIGVKVHIRVMEWQAFLNTVILPKRFEAVLLAWSVGLKPDAYSIWHSESYRKGGFNFVGYENKEVDRLIKEAEKIVDPDAFGKVYQKIFQYIAQDVPYLFLYIPNTITVINKNISPIDPALVGIMHNTIRWEKTGK